MSRALAPIHQQTNTHNRSYRHQRSKSRSQTQIIQLNPSLDHKPKSQTPSISLFHTATVTTAPPQNLVETHKKQKPQNQAETPKPCRSPQHLNHTCQATAAATIWFTPPPCQHWTIWEREVKGANRGSESQRRSEREIQN